MGKKYQKDLLKECLLYRKAIEDTIDTHLPKDFFCGTSRSTIIEDISNNLFIQKSPAIVCILDFSKKGYLYVSDNLKNELDIPPDDLLREGLALAMLSFEPNQKELFLSDIYPVIFETYASYALKNEAKDLHVSYNTLLKSAVGEYVWYHHQMSVLACDEKGYPRYGLKLITNIQDYKKDENLNFMIHRKTGEASPEIIYSRDYLPHEIDRSLSQREKEIMKLVAEGNSTKMIAEKLYISTNTVSTHRKNFSRKLKRVAV